MRDSKKYELAVWSDVYFQFPSSDYVVNPAEREVYGFLSESKREIDISIFERKNTSRPIIIIECKNYNRKLHIKDIETFIGMRDDIKPTEKAILCCPEGFSKHAQTRANSSNIISLGSSLSS